MTVAEFVERFLSRVEVVDGCDCWLWTGANDGRKGYGRTRVPLAVAEALAAPGMRVAAHRASYHVMRLPLSPEQQLDHLCGRKRCVNPFHLEPVTAVENALRANAVRAGEAGYDFFEEIMGEGF